MDVGTRHRTHVVLAFISGAASFGLVAFLVTQGLDRADKWASVISAAIALLTLVTAFVASFKAGKSAVTVGDSDNRPDTEDGSGLAGRFFHDVNNPQEIESLMKVSRVVWMWGSTLKMHIPYFAPLIEERLAQGRETRILLIAPTGASIQMAAFRTTTETEESLNSRVPAIHAATEPAHGERDDGRCHERQGYVADQPQRSPLTESGMTRSTAPVSCAML